MFLRTLTRTTLMSVGLAMAISLASAAESANQHTPLEKAIGQPAHAAPVPSLGVMNADGAMLADGKLMLTGISGNVIVFADRPVRAAGHETTETFISRWGSGKDNFKIDPPNATISVLGGADNGVTDAVVVLKNPKLDGTNLSFDVDVLEGDLKGLKGPAAVFIDWFAAGGRDGFVAGGFGHSAWYRAPVAAGIAAGAVAGAAIGAAAAAPYYPPPACGYYPYPPCY